MKKLYFGSGIEKAFDLDFWKDHMICEKLTELELCEAKIVRNSEFFFCNKVREVGEKGECGKYCNDYKPRNGKSGICIHNRPVYEESNKVKKLHN